jgi:hypothetical protein
MPTLKTVGITIDLTPGKARLLLRFLERATRCVTGKPGAEAGAAGGKQDVAGLSAH